MRKAGHMGSAQWLTDVECANRLKSGGPTLFEHPSKCPGMSYQRHLLAHGLPHSPDECVRKDLTTHTGESLQGMCEADEGAGVAGCPSWVSKQETASVCGTVGVVSGHTASTSVWILWLT